MRLSWIGIGIGALCIAAGAFAAAPPPQTLLMEDMTWPEVASALKAGKTTVIVPTGGTEQNGPAIVLGKHNFILRYTALAIALKLGDALVAPVMPYVPEGDIHPPTGHMRFAGTFSLRPVTFAAFLEDMARSLKEHGFKTICFVGEHGASQPVQKVVAERLSALWKDEGVRVIQVSDYYDSDKNGQLDWAKLAYPDEQNIEAHGGFADTSEMEAAAVAPIEKVREGMTGPFMPSDYDKLGAEGSSVHASKLAGAKLLDLKVQAAVKQIERERR